MNIKDYINLAASIGTLISSIVVLFTLFELIKQRRSSYKPELVILEECFDFKLEDTEWAKGIPRWFRQDENKKDVRLELKLHNIGLGVARNVKFHWDYDIDLAVKTFKNNVKNPSVHLSIDKIENRIMYLESGEVMDGSSLSIDNSEWPFILPLSVNPSYTLLPLPASYLSICGALLKYADPKNLFNTDEFKDELFPLILNVTYEDIGNKLIKRTFKIDTSLFMRSLKVTHLKRLLYARGRVYIQEITKI